jgi:hypothetical protein
MCVCLYIYTYVYIYIYVCVYVDLCSYVSWCVNLKLGDSTLYELWWTWSVKIGSALHPT